MVSYTDVMTILLILFVAIAARGVPRNRPAVPAKPAAVPMPAPSPLERARSMLERKGLQPRLEGRGLVISLPQAVLFASGDDQVAASAMPTISEIADVLAGTTNHIVLAGYADATPIRNARFHSNWELSAARALSLMRLLNTELGVDASRMSVAGYGSYDPRESNETAAGRAENRRVEIIIQGS
jgi:chemotaxis protein MotB